jgi:hypothetical protein
MLLKMLLSPCITRPALCSKIAVAGTAAARYVVARHRSIVEEGCKGRTLRSSPCERHPQTHTMVTTDMPSSPRTMWIVERCTHATYIGHAQRSL